MQSLRALAMVFLGVIALATPIRADDIVPIALHLTPGRYTRTEKLVHLVTFEMNKALRSLAGTRADDKIVLEDRARVLVISDANALSETETNSRRFGGDNPKDKTVKERTEQYSGAIAANAVRTPARAVLGDAGDGALDQLPDIALAPGQTWTFSRRIRTDRELGEGEMKYTDKLLRVETRNGHRIAVIEVVGVGRIATAKDLEAKGFKEATMDFHGTAEFDTTAGLPGVQHYTGKVRWGTTVMFTHIGIVFDDTYDAAPLEAKPQG
jgi:hypothetical protein